MDGRVERVREGGREGRTGGRMDGWMDGQLCEAWPARNCAWCHDYPGLATVYRFASPRVASAQVGLAKLLAICGDSISELALA